MRISDWSSDVCSSDLLGDAEKPHGERHQADAVDEIRGVKGEAPDAGVDVRAYRADENPDRDHADPLDRRSHGNRRRRDQAEQHDGEVRSEEHTSELQSLMRLSYAVFCVKKKIKRLRRRKQGTTQ